jgi:geranylgeranylglycerol-phosphate geranylgeranyltransferase
MKELRPPEWKKVESQSPEKVKIISILSSLVKSRTLVYVFVIVSLGTFLIGMGSKIPDFSVVLRLVSGVYFVALATYLYNDLTDYNVDRINNRTTFEDKKDSRYYITLYFTILLFAVSISLAFSINFATGLGSLAFSALAITYSHPRTRLKEMFIVKTVVTASGAAIASVMGSLAAGNSSLLTILSSVIVFLFWFILGPLGDVSDIRGDRQGGRRTIPIVIGIQNTFVLMISIISFMALLIILSHFYLNVDLIGMLLACLICGFAMIQLKKLMRDYENKIKIKLTRTCMRYSIFGIQIALFIGSILKL